TAETFNVAFSPDGKRLASADATGGRVWDLITGQQVLRLKGPTTTAVVKFQVPGIDSLAFNPDGTRLVAVSQGSGDAVRICDANTGQELLACKAYEDEVNRQVGVIQDSKWLRMTIQATPRTLTVYPRVAYSSDGKRLAGRVLTEGLIIWDALTGREILRIN